VSAVLQSLDSFHKIRGFGLDISKGGRNSFSPSNAGVPYLDGQDKRVVHLFL
jgi:hypothetical protein